MMRAVVLLHRTLFITAVIAAAKPVTAQPTALMEAQWAAERGDFARAEELLKPHVADPDGPVVGPHAEARETLRRIRLDYSLTPKQALEKIRARIPDATAEDLERWREAGVLQHRVIDGEVRYFNREPSNLLRFSEEARRRATQASPRPGRFDLPAHISELVELSEESQEPELYPVDHVVTYQLTVPANHPRVRQGAVVGCWLPFPKQYQQQKNVNLIDASPPEYVIAPNAQPQRTIYFEQVVGESASTLTFRAQYEFTTYAYVPKLDPERAEPLDESNSVYGEHTVERLPHIAFTPQVREIVAKVAADEPNPLLKARKLYLWVCENLDYCAEMEYGTISSISDKGLSTRKGDCGVQGLVFITLCRAAGIPARWQSGWESLPGRENMHDWVEFYVAPWGWLPADPSYGLQKHDDPRVREFYFGHLDPYRMIVNTDYARELHPPKTSFRSEPNDFQRGEVEIDGHNLYFDEWDWKFDVETRPQEKRGERSNQAQR